MVGADMVASRKNDSVAASQVHARRAVRNARKKWPKANDQDAEEIESDLTQQLLQRKVADPVAWGTRYADRAFNKLYRRAGLKRNMPPEFKLRWSAKQRPNRFGEVGRRLSDTS